MDEKTTGIVTYLTLIGWIIALLTRTEKTEYTSFHIRQMLGLIVLNIAISIAGFILGMAVPKIAMIFNILYLLPFVLWIIGFIGAMNNEKKLVPVFGDKFQEWFKGIN